MDELLRDLRFALRSFRKHLGFSSVTTVTIALGIGGYWIVGALVAGQVLASQLYGITARDPLTLIGVALILMGVSAVATLFPTLRAVHIQPAVALKPK